MTDNKDESKDNPKVIPTPERISPAQESAPDIKQEQIKTPENGSDLQYEKTVSAELRREIEKMEFDENAKKEIEKRAEKIEFLGEKEKIERLLKMAKEKGLVFAVQVARKMNEPYLLDVLHDTLAKEGFYKDFIK